MAADFRVVANLTRRIIVYIPEISIRLHVVLCLSSSTRIIHLSFSTYPATLVSLSSYLCRPKMCRPHFKVDHLTYSHLYFSILIYLYYSWCATSWLSVYTIPAFSTHGPLLYMQCWRCAHPSLGTLSNICGSFHHGGFSPRHTLSHRWDWTGNWFYW